MILLVCIIVVALAFDFTNGFHDTANAIATSVSTRALSPRVAVAGAAVFNMAGAFWGQHVAKTVGKGIVETAHLTMHISQTLVLSALVAAIAWNLITWYFGIPSSSSHALIGGLVGAAAAAAGASHVLWGGLLDKVVIPMVMAPAIGFVVAFLVMIALLWLVARAHAAPVNRSFRRLQPLSAAAMAFAHGTNDAQKTMGIITLALLATHKISSFSIPWWVIVLAATAMAAGTISGGWRIIHTLGSKVIKLDPIHGFAAETSAAGVILLSTHFGYPLSTTHTITAAIMGTGATQRLSAVRWGVAGNILTAWVLTLPMAALFGAVTYLALHLFA
jgi:PiT family inorganic phosphate transporter